MTMTSDTNSYPRPPAGVHPPHTTPDYNSSRLRHPHEPLVIIPHTLSELTGPAYPYGHLNALDADLTRQHPADPIGQRITLQGRVLDEDGRPVPQTLIEICAANRDQAKPRKGEQGSREQKDPCRDDHLHLTPRS